MYEKHISEEAQLNSEKSPKINFMGTSHLQSNIAVIILD
jgi:hypothetical protein